MFILLALPDKKFDTTKKGFIYSQGYKWGHRNGERQLLRAQSETLFGNRALSYLPLLRSADD